MSIPLTRKAMDREDSDKILLSKSPRGALFITKSVQRIKIPTKPFLTRQPIIHINK